MSQNAIADNFQKLRIQLDELRETSTVFSNAFAEWYKELCESVEAAFGLDSDEFNSISAIKIEPPPELMNDAERVIEDIFDLDNAQHRINILSQEWFRKRTYEFDELISSYIMKLKSNK